MDNNKVIEFCKAVAETHARAQGRFKFLIGIRNKMVKLQKGFAMGTNEYTKAERRKNMWMEMLTRTREELTFLSSTLATGLADNGYVVQFIETTPMDFEYDIANIASMRELYNNMYNITTANVFKLTEIANQLVITLEEADEESETELVHQLKLGLGRFEKVIKVCIRDNYIRQKVHLGLSINEDEVKQLFKEVRPAEHGKVLIDD